MVENITNLTSASFSEPYVGNVLLAILIGVTILIFCLKERFRRSDNRAIRFQQLCGEWLKPGVIKLSYDGKGLRYNHQEDSRWQDFISVVDRQIKHRRYKARGLYEKVKKAVGIYEDLVRSANTEITSTFSVRLDKEDLKIITWDGEGEEPSDDFVNFHLIPHSIEEIIKKGTGSLTEQKDPAGRYTLLVDGARAKTYSESKKDKLKDLILSMTTDDKIKELIAKRDRAKNDDVEPALERYNNKLDEVIRDFRLYPRRGIST